MALDYLAIVNLLLDEVDEQQLTTTSFSTSTEAVVRRLKNYVNLVYRAIFQERIDWSWARLKDSFVTVTSQTGYELGTDPEDLNVLTDLEKIHYVQIQGEPTMELLEFNEFKRKYGQYETTTTGKPFVAYVLDSKLYLYPTPDDVYTVEYVSGKVFAELSDHDDEPYIPDSKRDVLFWGALVHAKGYENELSVEPQMYQQRLQALRVSESNNHKGYAMIPEEETVTAEYQQIMILE